MRCNEFYRGGKELNLTKEEKVWEIIRIATEKINAEEDLSSIDGGVKFENHVTMVIEEIAEDFGITVEQTGTQSFPDIIIGGSYGIEVKYTSSTKWQSTGNSIFEGTLRKEVTDQIYLLFGRKVGTKIDTRFKKYEECLADIKVTHSPRFFIDMEIEDGKDILNSIGITYNEFKSLPGSEKSTKLKKYVSEGLSEGETLWWLDSNQDEAISPVVKEFRKLENHKINSIIIESFILFPEILSTSSTKYLNLSVYLLQEYQIVSSSLRDVFSANGRREVMINGVTAGISQIQYKLYCNAKEIRSIVSQIPVEKLKEIWPEDFVKSETIDENNKLDAWKKLLSRPENNSTKELPNILIFEEGLKI